MNRYKDIKNRIADIERQQKTLLHLYNNAKINYRTYIKLNDSYFAEYYFLNNLLLQFK